MFALAYVDGGMPHVHVLRVGETLIGRTPACDLIINAPSVSRRHARLRVVGGRVFVRDADSTQGTVVNGVPIIEEQEIASGDTSLRSVRITAPRSNVGERAAVWAAACSVGMRPIPAPIPSSSSISRRVRVGAIVRIL